VILPDALESDAFRRLRVWLRWRYPVMRPSATHN